MWKKKINISDYNSIEEINNETGYTSIGKEIKGILSKKNNIPLMDPNNIIYCEELHLVRNKCFEVVDHLLLDIKFIKDKKRFEVRYNNSTHRLGSFWAVWSCANKDCSEITAKCQLTSSRGLQKKSSLCQKCYKSVYYRTEEYQNTFKRSMNKNHGVDYPLQSSVSHEKMYDTMEKRYGNKHSIQNDISNEKRKKTMKEKHGRENYFSDINPWIEFNFTHSCGPYLSKLEKSVVAEMDKLFINYDTSSYNNKRNRIRIDDRVFFPDYFIKELNLIIEAYGDYWHANPSYERFSDNFILSNSLTAKEVREKDAERENILRTAGYDFFIIWESDWYHNKDKVIKIIKDKYVRT